MKLRVFKIIVGFIIICAVQFICNCLVKTFNLIIPTPILGLIVFAFLLQVKVIKQAWIEDVCNFLLKIMPLLFVPLFVGIISYYGIIEKNLIPILVNIVLTTTLVLILTALFVENVIKFVRLHNIRKSKNE